MYIIFLVRVAPLPTKLYNLNIGKSLKLQLIKWTYSLIYLFTYSLKDKKGHKNARNFKTKNISRRTIYKRH